jgi:hypothetical protein
MSSPVATHPSSRGQRNWPNFCIGRPLRAESERGAGHRPGARKGRCPGVSPARCRAVASPSGSGCKQDGGRHARWSSEAEVSGRRRRLLHFARSGADAAALGSPSVGRNSPASSSAPYALCQRSTRDGILPQRRRPRHDHRLEGRGRKTPRVVPQSLCPPGRHVRWDPDAAKANRTIPVVQLNAREPEATAYLGHTWAAAVAKPRRRSR